MAVAAAATAAAAALPPPLPVLAVRREVEGSMLGDCGLATLGSLLSRERHKIEGRSRRNRKHRNVSTGSLIASGKGDKPGRSASRGLQGHGAHEAVAGKHDLHAPRPFPATPSSTDAGLKL